MPIIIKLKTQANIFVLLMVYTLASVLPSWWTILFFFFFEPDPGAQGMFCLCIIAFFRLDGGHYDAFLGNAKAACSLVTWGFFTAGKFPHIMKFLWD